MSKKVILFEEKSNECPLCRKTNIISYDSKIKCLECNKTYDIKILNLIYEVEKKLKTLSSNLSKNLLKQILDVHDQTTFVDLLNFVKNLDYFCPYCGAKIDTTHLVCTLCNSKI